MPQFFIAADAAARVTAINFIFDTLLFAGMMFIIGAALSDAEPVKPGSFGDYRPRGASRTRFEMA